MKNWKPNQNLAYEEGADISLNWFFTINAPEKLLETGRMDVLEFLGHFAPHKREFVKNILQKIKFQSNKVDLIVDITLPMYIGGYWNLKNTIAINPLYLLAADEKTIASILIHEGIHAGMYTDAEVHDESITEALTKKKMKETYHSEGISTAYDPMVDMLNEFIGEKTFEEVVELIESGDEDTLDNLLDLMVLGESVDSKRPEDFVWENIYHELSDSWKLIQKLFPRITNKIIGDYKNVHGKSAMRVQDYKLDGLLEKAAAKVVKDTEIMGEIFLHSFKDVKEIYNLEEAKKRLSDEGYAYLLDFESSTIEKFLQEFLNSFNVYLVANTSVDKDAVINSLERLEVGAAQE